MNIQIKKTYLVEFTREELIWIKSVLDSIHFELRDDLEKNEAFGKLITELEND